jgi:hypothetical protein
VNVNIKISDLISDNLLISFDCDLGKFDYLRLIGAVAQLNYTFNRKDFSSEAEKTELCNYYKKEIFSIL